MQHAIPHLIGPPYVDGFTTSWKHCGLIPIVFATLVFGLVACTPDLMDAEASKAEAWETWANTFETEATVTEMLAEKWENAQLVAQNDARVVIGSAELVHAENRLMLSAEDRVHVLGRIQSASEQQMFRATFSAVAERRIEAARARLVAARERVDVANRRIVRALEQLMKAQRLQVEGVVWNEIVFLTGLTDERAEAMENTNSAMEEVLDAAAGFEAAWDARYN